MLESPAVALALIGILGLGCQWLAWGTRLPAILFLILGGILFGPVMGWIRPDDLLGDLLFPLVSLCVALVLFEGSLTLKFEEIRGLASVVQRIIVIGAPITWAVITVTAFLILGVQWEIAWLFGTLVVVTGPTVIVPMLRSVRPNSRISNVLRWEGIVIDPIGALFAVLVYEYIVSSTIGEGLTNTLWLFARVLFIGGCIGALAGHTLGWLLRDHLIPDYLQTYATFAVVLCTFATSNQIEHESGLLAVTVMGVWLANMRGVFIGEILSFKEHLSVLLISGLFILLAARLDLKGLLALGWPPLLLLVVVQMVARPLAVFMSTLGTKLSWQEKLLISWIGPRGIVAAAISALFALRLEGLGLYGAEILVSLTFVIIIGTVVIASLTARPLARLLGVADPSPRGALIVGANRVARAIALALKEHGFRVLLVDSSWENTREARMEGLETFYGNPVSEYTDQHLDLAGIGRLLALSPQREINVLASLRYRHEFGRENVYALNTSIEVSASGKHSVSEDLKGYVLGSTELTFSKFSSLLTQGAKLRSTQLTENFSFDDMVEHNPYLVPLFAVDLRERLHFFCHSKTPEPEAGWKVVSLDYKGVSDAARERASGDEESPDTSQLSLTV